MFNGPLVLLDRPALMYSDFLHEWNQGTKTLEKRNRKQNAELFPSY